MPCRLLPHGRFSLFQPLRSSRCGNPSRACQIDGWVGFSLQPESDTALIGVVTLIWKVPSFKNTRYKTQPCGQLSFAAPERTMKAGVRCVHGAAWLYLLVRYFSERLFVCTAFSVPGRPWCVYIPLYGTQLRSLFGSGDSEAQPFPPSGRYDRILWCSRLRSALRHILVSSRRMPFAWPSSGLRGARGDTG